LQWKRSLQHKWSKKTQWLLKRANSHAFSLGKHPSGV
jgi:hypothetical protein